MQIELNDTIPAISSISGTAPKIHEDYSEILKSHRLEFKIIPPYLQVGELIQVQGWILHLSVVARQLEDLLKILIPVLIYEKIPFKIVSDKETACHLLDGLLGYTQLGKVVCIYPYNELQAVALAKELIPLTQSFNGPVIPTDAYLGSVVYTRYGSIQAVMHAGPSGRAEKFIYDRSGNLVKDNYTIPFSLPKGVTWPFTEITNLKIPAEKKLLNRVYKPIAVIKPDAKGNVIKGLFLKSLLSVKPCLIKQGKKNMIMDNAGRSIEDRLVWQKELYDHLADEIPLPKIFDLFREDGDTYLVMEFVKGNLLYDVVRFLHQDRSWFDLPLPNRLLLIDHLLEIIIITERLHKKGFVHRDITPFNFLVTKTNQIFLIDLELAYCLESDKPDPPFKRGTFGFMSPEQFAAQKPTVKEDVYGIGAIMIFFFSGLLPGKFNTENTNTLSEDLYFFFPVKSIAAVIAACLNPDPGNRPGLLEIKRVLQEYRRNQEQQTINSTTISLKTEVNIKKLKTTISGALSSLAVSPLVSPEKLWSSKKRKQENFIGNEQMGRSCYAGLHDGISGVLYLLAKAKTNGFVIDDCINVYMKNWEYVQLKYLSESSLLTTGLYTGTTGIALAIVSGIESGLIEPSEKHILKIRECLEQIPDGLSLASGITGQGIAVLNCASYLDADLTHRLLQKCTDQLLESQQLDGSWCMIFPGDKKGIPMLGFANGIAGITWFLLEYSVIYDDLSTRNAAVKALNYLTDNANEKRKKFSWQLNRKTQKVNPWINDDFTGIALAFIKAYEILKEPFYKEIAEAALLSLPRHIISTEFNQSHGLAGIGEVYLEAARVFKTPEWLERVNWIANLFIHTMQQQSDGSIYWFVDTTSSFPTADLMVGNGGIIHFLMRYLMPDKLGCPLLPPSQGMIRKNSLN